MVSTIALEVDVSYYNFIEGFAHWSVIMSHTLFQHGRHIIEEKQHFALVVLHSSERQQTMSNQHNELCIRG